MKEKKNSGLLDWIERIGNKIPDPFIMFLGLAIFVVIVSAICSSMGVHVINPVTQKVVPVKNLLAPEGVIFMLKEMVRNFTGFAPLGLVLVMTLGIGLAEHTGMLSALMRATILSMKASPTTITFLMFVVGVCGNTASDAAIIIVPSICAFVFLTMGRHPLAGIAIGYASTAGGFNANLMINGTDPLLGGISTEAVKSVAPDYIVPVLANWYFMAMSTIVLAILGTYVTVKIVEPRLGKYTGKVEISHEEVTPLEKAGLKKSAIWTLIYVALVGLLVLPPNSFMRNAQTKSLLNSPFLDSVIPLIFLFFVVAGVGYAVAVGKVKSMADVPKYMTMAVRDMSSYIVLVFVIAQFISYFNWSNLGLVLAVNGAEMLKGMNLTGIPLFVMFIVLCSVVNIFIGSGSAKWALLAPIFVPMFYMLGYTPELTQGLYRVGDSATNVISPLFPYLPIILGYVRKYDEKSGIGTIISLMMPYCIWFLVGWIIMTIAWIGFDIPIGPGIQTYL